MHLKAAKISWIISTFLNVSKYSWIFLQIYIFPLLVNFTNTSAFLPLFRKFYKQSVPPPLNPLPNVEYFIHLYIWGKKFLSLKTLPISRRRKTGRGGAGCQCHGAAAADTKAGGGCCHLAAAAMEMKEVYDNPNYSHILIGGQPFFILPSGELSGHVPVPSQGERLTPRPRPPRQIYEGDGAALANYNLGKIFAWFAWLFFIKWKLIIWPYNSPRGLQRNVVYLCWPIAPSYLSPNAGGRGELRGLSQWVQLCTWSPNKLLRSNSIFNLCNTVVRTANEGSLRIRYKCLVSMYVFPEMKLFSLLISKTELELFCLPIPTLVYKW